MRKRSLARRVTDYLSRNAVALVALCVALAGTSYAAIRLPANSVGTTQIRNSAVTLKKISRSTRTALKGQRGPQGIQGVQGVQGIQGAAGTPGAAGRSALAPLGAGETETGAYGMGAGSYTSGTSLWSAVTFPIPLRAGLDGAHVVYITGGSGPHCPGVGQSESGYLCVYETANNAVDTTTRHIVNPTSAVAAAGTSTSGFIVEVNSLAAANPAVYEWGTWAVTG